MNELLKVLEVKIGDILTVIFFGSLGFVVYMFSREEKIKDRLITIGQEIYSQVPQFMDAIESSKESGASKKEWHLLLLKT